MSDENTLWTAAFWRGAGERALKTFAQAEVAAIGVGALAAGTIADVAWSAVLGTGALAAVLSIFTSIGNADFTAGRSSRTGPAA